MATSSNKFPSLLDVLDNSSTPEWSIAPSTPVKRRAYPIETHNPRSGTTSGSSSNNNRTSTGTGNTRENKEEDDSSSDLAALLSSPLKRISNSSGFRLNYDFETPALSIDRGGPDQFQKMAEFVTREIDNMSHSLTVATAMQELGLTDEKDMLPGMEVRLLPHQVIGVTWMLSKERDGSDKGGIMADDMGLGKTVQMIATMVMNPAPVDDECKTTLIVVPAALLQQWKDEVESKTNGMFTCHIHHGRHKLKKISDVREFDVVITTYHTLLGDFQIPNDVEASEEADWLSKNGGILARVKFYRAVADEAQFIRNRATRTSISLAHVRARYRWMLTGTPVTNTLADIYGLIRFGRFRPWNDWETFNIHICKVQLEDAPLAGSRAQAILKPILLRRTKDSTLEGKPILQLPPKAIELVRLQFSEDERDLYDSFERRSKIRINKFIREKTVLKNHAIILVMILRLRQLCCHPNLILSQTEGYEDPTLLMATEGEKELGKAKKAMGNAWVDDIKQRFMTRALATDVLGFEDEADTAQAICPMCKDVLMGDAAGVLMCGHELCFDCVMNLSQAPIEHDGIFGEGNEKENNAAERAYENAAAKGHRPCPTCKKMVDLSPSKVFKFSAFEPSDEEFSKHLQAMRRKKKRESNRDIKIRMRSPTPEKTFEQKGMDDSDDDMPDVSTILGRSPAKKLKRMAESDDEGVDEEDVKGKVAVKNEDDDDDDIQIVAVNLTPRKKTRVDDKSLRKQQGRPENRRSGNKDGPSRAVIDIWSRGDDEMEPSTKMVESMKMLREWNASGDKTIVYSQWTSMLDLLEILLSRHGIRHLRFDGKLDQPSRRTVLTAFQNPGGAKVILISTKCGGVGLNLVSANRIVNMDLSWNYASESQAYDRVHRIGQQKDVFIKRLVIENTIEERMLRLQDVKVGLAEAALGEGSGLRLHKLSVRDIKYLFGMTGPAAPAPQQH